MSLLKFTEFTLAPLISSRLNVSGLMRSSNRIRNEVFTPTPEAVAEAREILAAMEAAKADGLGATTYKGKLIDIASMPFARPDLDILLSRVVAIGNGYPARGTRAG